MKLSSPSHQCCFALLTIVLAYYPLTSFGLGARIPNQDAEAIGRGNAFAATADNPAAIYYNPAGITQLEGHNLQLGSLFYLGIYSEYKSPLGQTVDNERKVIPVPELHYVWSPAEKPYALGLGIYSPFGLGMEWPDTAPFRSAGLEAELTYATINPVFAYKLHPKLSLAIGPTFNYTEAELVQGQPAPGFQFRFKGHDWTYGFNAGLLWHATEHWSFGAKYFAATEAAYGGTASFRPAADFLPPPTSTRTHLNFPQIVVGAVSYRPTPQWNLEFDVDWTDWDNVRSAEIEHFGGLPLNWHSSFFYHFGVTRNLGQHFYVSAGYFFSEASTPDRDYTPLVPDTDLHVGSLGAGYKGSSWTAALGFQLIGGDWRDVSNAANVAVNGKYRLFTPTIAFSVGRHF